ncbi:type II toxin-antitoxin system HicB family antitoxin [Methanosarcina sp. 2.H.A.1B.4]|uniref:type II toxin-antitoxin system HicB family antitoxin n=1 Tax=Methanosarcina sp. 2.H.A.1B.4 TaxID=1483600 RepID=UPI000B1F0914|nr:type II toxin-antitoxin system HicB family antitoxin [Methanosarcina sp. 2.H.A.1B.4]
MEETYRFSAVVHNEGKWYVSWCPELDVASQGETIEEAIENLKEAIELYLEDEDAQIPAARQVFTTTVEVSSHAKTSHPSALEVIKALNSQGFQVVSQKGSHIK